MKSCQCVQCSVSRARFAWGFALLARDGWAVSSELGPLSVLDGAWLCPTCCTRNRETRHCLARPAVTRAATREQSRLHGNFRVLLVDDEEIVRRCTARALSDFAVVSVGSAAEALSLLQKDSDFDAVLSDVMMPGMSGPEFFARCHESFPLLAQRFVFASGNPELARVELRRVVQRVGAEHAPILLAKPSARESLSLALFAAAAHTAARSGTYSVIQPLALEVTKYRG